MKVQFTDQTLRLRIDESEMQRLLAGETLDNATHWPDGGTTHQRVALASANGWRRDVDGWCMLLARSAAEDFAARLPARDGLEIELGAPGGLPLEVRFDVDTRDSARRRLASKRSHHGKTP